MQQWKVSKARLHTGYRLSGRSERNSAGPTLENMSRASRDEERHDEVVGVKAGIAALRKELAWCEEQLSERLGFMMKLDLEDRIKNIQSEIKLKQSVLENMGGGGSSSLDLSSSSASGVGLAREVTPEPIESVMSSSSPSSSPGHQVQAENSPSSVRADIDSEEDPGSELASYAGSSASLDNDYGYEPYLAVNASLFHDVLEPRVQDVQKFCKKTFPKVERKLKARIEFRKMLNQRFRARVAEIEECKKYAATLKKLEQELDAARAETHVLEGSMMQAVETVDDSLDEWAKLAGKWVVE